MNNPNRTGTRLTKTRSAKTRLNRNLLSCALVIGLALAAPAALAQSTGATLRGQAGAGAKVTVTNVASGYTRSTDASASGSYSLAGLPPGTYRVEGGVGGTRTITLQVAQIATVDLAAAAPAPAGDVTNLDTVQVIGQLVPETRTSEVATYVSNKQIEALPQGTRNFLAFADIVPGMQFAQDGAGRASLRSGAQSGNNINVFIDGVGQKNYVLQGGISGQDSSNGNPFPQLAIGEYKVISSNYKAEFDQVSSAAVVAVTKSGGNEFSGSLFWDRFSDNWRTKTIFEKRNNTDKVDYSEEHYGVSFGGPIIRDRAHFFLTYEGKEQTNPATVIPGRNFAVSSLPSEYQPLVGATSVPFKEDLYFGKIDWLIGMDHYFEFTVKHRTETEITNIGGTNTRPSSTSKDNDETRYDLRYQFTSGDWLNDAHLTYEDAAYNPRPTSDGMGIVLTDANWWETVLAVGAGPDYQNKSQKGWSFQDDLSFSGIEGHSFKMGMKYKAVELSAAEQQPYNPQFYYDLRNNELAVPNVVRFGYALPGIGDGSLKSDNKQFGVYFQDDWQVTDKLTVNLGARWDYESSPSYTNYVTPTSVLNALNAVDPRGNGTQTYRQSLALGGIDIDDYISNGNNRDNFKGAWQPRLGFSYDMDGDQRHVVFGGIGRSYDRNLFDWLQLETTKATFPTYEYHFNTPQHPCTVGSGNCIAWNPNYLNDRNALYALVAAHDGNREINMLSNGLSTPYSDQFSIGMRNLFPMWGQEWVSSVTLSRIVSKDGFAFLLGNRRPNGGFFDTTRPGTTEIPWGAGVPGFGSLILGSNGIETRANSLLVSLEKPYSQASGWGATLAYTYTDAKENRQFGEHYALQFATLADYGWSKAGGAAPHRLVLSGIYDAPWDITLSGKLALATQAPRYGTNCLAGWDKCVEQDQYTPDGTLGYKRFDLAAEKKWAVWGDMKLRLRADLLNVFDWVNYNGYDDWWGAPGEPNANFGKPNSQLLPTRTFKLSVGLDW